MSEQDRIRYLSNEWLNRAGELLGSLPPIPESVAVAIVVRGGPDGDRRYVLDLGPDRVGIEAGSEDGGVRLTMDWGTAVSIARGEGSAQRAFLDGDLQLGGDASLLLGHQKQLSAIDDRLGPLRAITDFG